jgi:hypothetical protein
MPVFRLALPVLLAVAMLVVAAADARPTTANQPKTVVDFARAQLGKPYEYGAIGLARYDCSGLVYRAFREAGLLELIGGGRKSARNYFQWFRDRGLVTDQPRPGDLVAWGSPVGHVGIYTGTGDGGRHRAISALVNPWGVSDHRVDGINLPFRAFLRVNYDGDASGSQTSSVAVSAPTSDLTMNLRKGKHKLFQLDQSGATIRQTTISRSSSLTVDVDPKLRVVNGRPHAEIKSGAWQGWWRRVPDAAPDCCLFRFGTSRTLRLGSGDHLIKSFHANNRVVIRRHLQLDRAITYDVEYRATFNGKRHFLIASGEYAGYWMVKSANSRLLPLD